METVLKKIIADKRLWIEARKAEQPEESFAAELVPSDRSFVEALSTIRTAFILECKKASPSRGLIREDFDLDHIAGVYGRHADVISILTDEKYFQGKFDFLRTVRSRVSLPVLCKDFFIDPYQIRLARHYGADAILLMLSVLNDDEYKMLAAVAENLRLGILTEVSCEEEAKRAVALNATVVGINNRNLRDLSIDLERTRKLAPLFPAGTLLISESGISSHSQVRDLSRFVDGFLIGSSLMSEADLETAARRLIYGDNKVCGLTRPKDARAACDANAVYGGLIFVESSPRFISEEKARTVISAAPLRFVGVFRNESVDIVAGLAKRLGLAAVQLHGDEDEDYVENLRPLLPEGAEIWKAHGVSDRAPEFGHFDVERHLIDTRIGERTGGTGETFDWSLLDGTNRSRLMLAGGLSAENAKDAAAVGCLGLDFNSGVETAPGIKDTMKISAAFAALRDY